MTDSNTKFPGLCSRKGSILPLHKLEQILKKITEPEFRQACATTAIKSVEICDTEGGYILVVQLTWKDGAHTLYTQRNRLRTWSSLNSIVDFLTRLKLQIPLISIRLRYPTPPKDQIPP